MVHAWHFGHDESIVVSDELEVVGGAGGTADEFLKGEVGGFAAGTGYFDFAAPDDLRVCVGRVVDRIAEEVEPFLRVASCVFAERVVVDCRWGTGDFAVICGGVKVDDCEIGLEEVDAWDERFALNAVFVQFVGVAIGCGDENDAVGHEDFEKAG